MRAAIYARQPNTNHQQASLETQISEAKRYADSKGWTIDDSHIFAEEATESLDLCDHHALLALLSGCRQNDFELVLISGDVTPNRGILVRAVGDILEGSVTPPQDTSRLIDEMRALVAQRDREQRSEKARASWRKRKAGPENQRVNDTDTKTPGV